MKESYWGYWLVLLGVFVVVIMLLIRNVTSNTTEDYYTVNQISEASMVAAVDYAYYREYKELKINKEKFMEVFLRMLANQASGTDDYEILWLSQNEKIARVDNGIVTGVDVGETIIVATTGNKITSCTVKIIDDNSQIIEPEKPETQITNPSKVKNVKAKVQDANSVTITWNSVPEEITGYKVFKYNPETNTCEFIGKTKNTEYTISNLKDGTEYSFRVRAYKTVDSVQYVGKLSGELKTATKPIKEKIANITTKNQKVTITWKETTGTGYGNDKVAAND